MLAVPNKTDFCKVSALYDIPNFSKLYSKSFGMGPNAPTIIGTINISLSHILFLIVALSTYPVFRFFSESRYYQRDTQHQLSNIFSNSFP